MNRMNEYESLLQELDSPPEHLKTTAERAVNRVTASQRKRRAFRYSAGSFAACFVGFVLLVNTFPTFAKACGNIPLLKELAEAVSFSPSLTAAVEHEYVQPMNLTQTQNGVTATVEHVIVDRKQVSTFFTLDAKFTDYLDYEWDIEIPGEEMGWSSSSSGFGQKNGELRHIDTNFMDIDVPPVMELTLKVFDSTADWTETEPAEVEYHGPSEPAERVYVAEFHFTLEFDPYFTAQGEVIPVNTDFIIDGQTMTLTEVEVYPTHLRVNLDDAPENTAWLKGLDLYLENERGEQYHSGINGISAAGDPDGEGYATFWLDSPFFGQGKHLNLYITGAHWLEKEGNQVLVDPQRGTAENLPDGIRFLGARLEGSTYWLAFIAPKEPDGGMYQLFSHRVLDEAGNELPDIMSWGHVMGYRPAEGESSVEEETMFTEDFPLNGYTGGKLLLEPIFTHVTDLTEAPVGVTIK